MLSTGNLIHQVTDLNIPNRGVPFNITRSYNSQSPFSGVFGNKWTSNLDEKLLSVVSTNPVTLLRADGAIRIFGYLGGTPVTYSSPAGFDYALQYSGGLYTLRSPQGEKKIFDSNGLPISIIDRNGAFLKFNYSGVTITSISDGTSAGLNGRSVVFAYDGNGHVSTMSDPINRTTVYGYSSGDLTSVNYPGGRNALYFYNSGSYMNRSKDPAYRKGYRDITYTYDSSNRVTHEADALGNMILDVSNYASFANNASTTFTEAGGSCSSCGSQPGGGTYIFDTTTGQATTFIDANGQPTSFVHNGDLHRISWVNTRNVTTSYGYDANSNPTTITNNSTNSAASITTYYSYDLTWNVPTTFIDGMGRATTYRIDSANGNVTVVSGPLSSAVTYTYNTKGDRTSTTDANGKATTFLYDGYGGVTMVQDADSHQPTYYSYDLAGRLKTVTDGRGNVTRYSWDAADRLVQVILPGGGIMSYSYDESGNRTSQTDPNGKTTFFAYDSSDHLLWSVDPNGHSTHYQYDSNGNLSVIEDQDHNHTTFSYDALRRLTEQTDALGHSTSFDYNSVGSLITRTDAKGNVTQYDYDKFERPVTVTYPDSSTVQNTYDNAGNLTQRVESNIGTTSYTYDNLNRLVNISDPYGNAVSYVYDAVGNVKALNYPDGAGVTYLYNGENAVTYTGFSSSNALTIKYDDNLNPVTLSGTNAVSTIYKYDARNAVTAITANGETGGTIPDFTYTYDLAGNRTIQSAAGVTSTFGYDGANQMTTAAVTATGPVTLNQTYQFDPAGNRTRLQENHDVTLYEYGEGNQLTKRTFIQNVAMGKNNQDYVVASNRGGSFNLGRYFTRTINKEWAQARFLWYRFVQAWTRSAQARRPIRLAQLQTGQASDAGSGLVSGTTKPMIREVVPGAKGVVVDWAAANEGVYAKPETYLVYRSNYGKAYSQIGSVDGTVLEYTDEAAPTSSEICYQVSAVSGGQESDKSNESCLTLNDSVYPTDTFTFTVSPTVTPTDTPTPPALATPTFTPSTVPTRISSPVPTAVTNSAPRTSAQDLTMVKGRPEYSGAQFPDSWKYRMVSYYAGTDDPYVSEPVANSDLAPDSGGATDPGREGPIILRARPQSALDARPDLLSAYDLPESVKMIPDGNVSASFVGNSRNGIFGALGKKKSKKGFRAMTAPSQSQQICWTGDVLVDDDFSANSAVSYTSSEFDWDTGNSQLEQTYHASHSNPVTSLAIAHAVTNTMSDYIVEGDFKVNASPPSGSLNYFGLVFREGNDGSYYTFQRYVTIGGADKWRILKYYPAGLGTSVTLASDIASPAYTRGNWVHMKVWCQGTRFVCLADFGDGNGDQLVYDVVDTTAAFGSGGVGVMASYTNESSLVKVGSFKVTTCLSPPNPPCGGVGALFFDDFGTSSLLSNYGFLKEAMGTRNDFAVTQGILLNAPTTTCNDIGAVQDSLVSFNLSDYTVEGDFKADQTSETFGLVFRASSQAPTTYACYYFQWNGSTNKWEFGSNVNGAPSILKNDAAVSFAYSAPATVHLRAVCRSNTYKCYLTNGSGENLIYSYTDSSYLFGGAGFGVSVVSANTLKLDNFQVSGCDVPTATPVYTFTSTFTPTITPTSNHTPAVTTYEYDNNGNLHYEINAGSPPTTITYEYNYENRLKRIVPPTGSAVTYTYNYAGNLLKVSSSSGATTYAYGMGVAPVVEKNSTATSDFLPAMGRNLMMKTGGNQKFIHQDALGNVVAVTSSTGAVNRVTAYDPYGRIIYNTGASTYSSEFIGGYGVRDVGDTNRYVMGVRTYDASLGRFTSQDSLGFQAGDNNFYRYARNNPLIYTDPTGNVTTTPGSPEKQKLYTDCGNAFFWCIFKAISPIPFDWAGAGTKGAEMWSKEVSEELADQAAGHACSLVAPNKSSIYRDLISQSKIFGKLAKGVLAVELFFMAD